MSRSAGSLSSKEAKIMSQELEQILDTPYKYNFSILRVIELLLCQRIVESVCSFDEDVPYEDREITVEIPLIGDLTISPRVFHEQHRLTNESSLHFDFKFSPSSGFKSDILRAYQSRETQLADIFANIYGERLKDLYNRLEGR